MEQQRKKRNRGNSDLLACFPRSDAFRALVIRHSTRKTIVSAIKNVLIIRAVAMLWIDREKKALEPIGIGVNNRLKPLINLV
jgi:hypothetical protein